jgi:hypothetical protein
MTRSISMVRARFSSSWSTSRVRRASSGVTVVAWAAAGAGAAGEEVPALSP